MHKEPSLRLARRASYWLERMEMAMARGDIRDAGSAQEQLLVLGWVVVPAPRPIAPTATSIIDEMRRRIDALEAARDGRQS